MRYINPRFTYFTYLLTAAILSPNNPSFIYLFKHQQQRAQATYRPEKSSTFMHVKQ